MENENLAPIINEVISVKMRSFLLSKVERAAFAFEVLLKEIEDVKPKGRPSATKPGV